MARETFLTHYMAAILRSETAHNESQGKQRAPFFDEPPL